MAPSANLFDLLGIDDNDDVSHLLDLHQKKIAAQKAKEEAAAAAAQKAKEEAAAAGAGEHQDLYQHKGVYHASRNVKGDRNGAGSVRERDRSHSSRREFVSNGNGNGYSRGDNGQMSGASPPSYGNRDFRGNVDAGDGFVRASRGRRNNDRHASFRNGGAGDANNGLTTPRVSEQEPIDKVEDKALIPQKLLDDSPVSEEIKDNNQAAVNKERQAEKLRPEREREQREQQERADKARLEREREEKEMTLPEYLKVLDEKRKALLAEKAEERKVEIDRELESMQQLSLKKENNEVFIKLGSVKDAGKRKEDVNRDEKTKKSVSISEFLKPLEGERSYRPGGRRGRGRGDRGGGRVDFGNRGGSVSRHNTSSSTPAPSTSEYTPEFPPSEFPPLKAWKK